MSVADEKAEAHFDAFISYSHNAADLRWAKWLQHALESYKTPRQLVRTRGLKPRLKAFRDDSDLGAAPDLTEAIVQRLSRSRWLIVVCSPRIKKSRWVLEEIRRFRLLSRSNRVLALVVEGEPSDVLSVVGAGDRASDQDSDRGLLEPLAADVRNATGWGGRKTRKLALLKLAAALHDCELDDLRRRDLERVRQRHGLVAAGIGAAVLAGLAWYGWTSTDRYQISRLVRDAPVASLITAAGNAYSQELSAWAVALVRSGHLRDARTVVAQSPPEWRSLVVAAISEELRLQGDANAARAYLAEAGPQLPRCKEPAACVDQVREFASNGLADDVLRMAGGFESAKNKLSLLNEAAETLAKTNPKAAPTIAREIKSLVDKPGIAFDDGDRLAASRSLLDLGQQADAIDAAKAAADPRQRTDGLKYLAYKIGCSGDTEGATVVNALLASPEDRVASMIWIGDCLIKKSQNALAVSWLRNAESVLVGLPKDPGDAARFDYPNGRLSELWQAVLDYPPAIAAANRLSVPELRVDHFSKIADDAVGQKGARLSRSELVDVLHAFSTVARDGQLCSQLVQGYYRLDDRERALMIARATGQSRLTPYDLGSRCVLTGAVLLDVDLVPAPAKMIDKDPVLYHPQTRGDALDRVAAILMLNDGHDGDRLALATRLIDASLLPEILPRLAKRMAATGRLMVLPETLGAIKDGSPRVDALNKVLDVLLAQGQLEDARRLILGTYDDEVLRKAGAYSAIELAGKLRMLNEPSRARHALSIALELTSNRAYEDHLNAAIAPELAALGDGLAAVAAAERISDATRRVRSLIAVAPTLAGIGQRTEGLASLSRALKAAEIGSESERSRAFAEIAVALADIGEFLPARTAANRAGEIVRLRAYTEILNAWEKQRRPDWEKQFEQVDFPYLRGWKRIAARR